MTENVEVTLPSFPEFQYSGEFRLADQEYFLSSFTDEVKYADNKTHCKVHVMKEVKNERKQDKKI